MAQVFVLQNQHRQFLSKQREWLDGHDANSLYRSAHRDEALNQMVEANSKDYTLRIRVLACEANAKRNPIISDEDQLPLAETEVSETTVDIMTPFETAPEIDRANVSLFARGAVSEI